MTSRKIIKPVIVRNCLAASDPIQYKSSQSNRRKQDMNTTEHSPLRIGTRGSLLARAQANLTLNLLKAAYPQDPAVQNATLVIITTTGDQITDRPLAEIGGKGLFSKEIEEALRNNEIDIAVHSLKDMETIIAPDLMLAAYLEREDARDVMISALASTLQELPPGSIVGTCAPRRIAQILHLRPDLICIPLRGNVDTRIRKLQEGQMQAIILAFAGLKRLGRASEATYIFPESEMLPAVGQGALTLQCRKGDARIQSYLAPLNHDESERCITAERTLLAGLDGNCRTPIGAHATIDEKGQVHLNALIASPSGKPIYRTEQVGDDPVAIGMLAAEALNKLAGPGFWDISCAS
jgi:hydroxymethylbilane synthase